MKKTYMTPVVEIDDIDLQESLLITISDTQVSGNNGGWVKEEVEESEDWGDIWN